MSLEIVWSPLALARLQEIRAYIALDSPDAAERLATRLVSVVQALADFPMLGRPGADPQTRELVVGGTSYVVLYLVKRDRILIRTVWHTAQKRSEAPEAYHFAAAWSSAAASLERKVCFPYFREVYPPTYLVAVGPTGDHKTSAERTAIAQAEKTGLRVIRGGGSGEGMIEKLQEGPCLVFMEEFSTLLRTARWEGATLGPMLTEVFDCPPRCEKLFRKKPIVVEQPTLSLLSGTTPEWFWRDARDVDLTGGLGNRLLFFDGVPQKPVALPGLVDVDFWGEVLERLARTEDTVAGLTPQAEAQWLEFYSGWRKDLERRSPLEAAMTKRSDVYALKLALVYAALEETLPFITSDQLSAAILAVRYAAGAVKRLIDLRQAGTNPVKDLEARILATIKKHSPITRRYLQQWLHKYSPSARDFNQAFEALVRSEQITIETVERGRTWVKTPD